MGVVRVMTLVMYILFLIGDSPCASCVVVGPILCQGTAFPEQSLLAIVSFVTASYLQMLSLFCLIILYSKRLDSSCVALRKMKHLQRI